MAPLGIIINSWISILLFECSPPFKILNIGIGITGFAESPVIFLYILEKCLYKGIFCIIDAAFAVARETAKIAFAPIADLSDVPSNSISILSISF